MRLLLTVLVVFLLLCANELWWRRHAPQSEVSRKFIHITVGSFVAFWPFFLPWWQIILLSLAFVIVVSISKKLNLFSALHSVQRPTWGELSFALAVGSVALVTHNKWIYMAALLQMSLADGLAAVAGVHFGKTNSYLFMRHTKSIVGTLTFFICSFLILVVYRHLSGVTLPLLFIAGVSLLSSLIENVSIKGLDNLVVPLLVAILLTYG